MQVLPNEGSYAGRAVYRAANLYQAMDQFSKHRYDAALKSIKASEEWPENLGVGKPYDDQINGKSPNPAGQSIFPSYFHPQFRISAFADGTGFA